MNREQLSSKLKELKELNILANHPLAYLMDKPRDKDISDLNPNIGVNDMYIFISNISSKPLSKGDSFDVLVPLSNPSNYLYTPIAIKYISMKKNHETEILYNGYSAIGQLEFKDGIPPIIDNLKLYMLKDKSKNESFYLMTKELLNLVLNLDSFLFL